MLVTDTLSCNNVVSFPLIFHGFRELSNDCLSRFLISFEKHLAISDYLGCWFSSLLSLRNYYKYRIPNWAIDFVYLLHPEGIDDLVDQKIVVNFVYILHPENMADLVDRKMVVDTSTKPYCQNPLVADLWSSSIVLIKVVSPICLIAIPSRSVTSVALTTNFSSLPYTFTCVANWLSIYFS